MKKRKQWFVENGEEFRLDSNFGDGSRFVDMLERLAPSLIKKRFRIAGKTATF